LVVAVVVGARAGAALTEDAGVLAGFPATRLRTRAQAFCTLLAVGGLPSPFITPPFPR
jgi:hypothetical protein